MTCPSKRPTGWVQQNKGEQVMFWLPPGKKAALRRLSFVRKMSLSRMLRDHCLKLLDDLTLDEKGEMSEYEE